ncbi:phytanoyl-CoA dioxygenase family protein [Brevundimonas sp. Root1279]|uniref:phytanoyl-CoA dioxygenase family protein n=1 Tax=Brevundimonas sp. Root1279 TaxID=1736443 RepID=UPI0006F5D80B|nr:phytanoyl-CoA dioxygenase family protein [Brevundimonas sp. Root1279]KQW79674.1 phytanoyl-CoA dioxygenase [Brevundimonas sp. Root1279]
MSNGETPFEREGAQHFPGSLTADEVEDLRAVADAHLGARPGARLTGSDTLSRVLSSDGPVGAVATVLTSPAARPVRAVLFDKSPAANWVVAWHQDRTIPVRARTDAEGFGPWSSKDGILHVAPPFEVLARMITLRVHLDPVDADNAPLRFAVGTHRIGRVAAEDAVAVAARAEQRVCLAETGDIWAYRTPILHASDRAAGQRRRRVLQVDYADFDLPAGLEWRGLAA